MADNIKTVLSLRATTADKVKDLVIKNGQLIFVTDEGRIALDYGNKRTFYNQIIELNEDQERLNLSNPINGKYYFVIGTAIFWRYYNGWKQLTSTPGEIIFIGTEMPELGRGNMIYADTTEEHECIRVWDEETNKYIIVANKTYTIGADDVLALFNN